MSTEHPESTKEITRDQVLSVLDFEISRITSEQERPGWTKWAIFGGLTSVVWLLLELWEKGGMKAANVLQLLTVLLMLLQITDDLKFSRTGNKKNNVRGTRFKFVSDIQDRSKVAFTIVINIFLTFIAIRTSSGIWWPQVTIVLFYSIGTILGNIWIMISTAIKYPLPIKNEKRKTTKGLVIGSITVGVFTLIILWALSGYFFSALQRKPEGLGIADLRISSLILVAVILIRLLVTEASHTPLLSRLIEVRRDLAFGRIELDTAITQAENLIAGMKATQVFQEELDEIFEWLNVIEWRVNQIIIQLREIRTLLPANRSEDSYANLEKAKMIYLYVFREIDNLEYAVSRLKKMESALGKQMKRVVGHAPEYEIQTEITQLAKRIASDINHTNEEVNKVSVEIEELRQVYEFLLQDKDSNNKVTSKTS